ncbi:MAG: 2'-deoxycytidine 5'-triphosphate deaminase [Candidatus Nanoarchaeia archaeon]|nr:2'-deoxycytidine 5'-triphosphate deaminase [Candidatus Nanoarchaeia archaeon]
MSLDRCLNDIEIEGMINQGRLLNTPVDNRIQPCSFDPRVGNEIFIIDAEEGLFRPNNQESVYRTLLQLPGRRREKVNIKGGFELKKGFTYLIPIEEKIILDADEYLKSSPKSSLGRLFLDTRMLTDYNSSFDEVSGDNVSNKTLNLWLLTQPLAFNIILYPEISLNQLRFFKGDDSRLPDSEIKKEFAKNPLLYSKDGSGKSIPISNLNIRDGLDIHLDLSGKGTQGIVGLRARHNPDPIDISKKNEYDAEEFFEPLKGNKINLKRGELYLFYSAEILKIPPHLSAEMNDHSKISLRGPLHFAGFIDSGFTGDLAFEIRSDEVSPMELNDNMPISKLEIFRNNSPKRIYGEEIGSSYNHQVGPRVSKHFKPFDFSLAARNYKKLDREVLVQDRLLLEPFRKNKIGFEFFTGDESMLIKTIEKGFFQSRYDCEQDELVLQPIPYVILLNDKGQVFSYVRTEDIKDYGDKRLFGKYSVGVGGHINKTDKNDKQNLIQTCLNREVFEEEVEIIGSYSPPKFVGTIIEDKKPVDRVHFGLVYALHVNGNVTPKEASIITGEMIPIKTLMNDPNLERYETWSQILIPNLDEIYKK